MKVIVILAVLFACVNAQGFLGAIERGFENAVERGVERAIDRYEDRYEDGYSNRGYYNGGYG